MVPGVDYLAVSVSCFCHDGKGRVVMTKRGPGARDEHGRWDLVGGHLEWGDSVAARIRAEIKEELDADVLGYEFLGFSEIKREHLGKPTHWLSLDFKVLVNAEKVKNNEPQKFDEVGWFRLNELPQPQHSQLQGFLEKYKDKL